MIGAVPPPPARPSDPRDAGDQQSMIQPRDAFAKLLQDGDGGPLSAPLAHVFNQDGFFGHAVSLAEANPLGGAEYEEAAVVAVAEAPEIAAHNGMPNTAAAAPFGTMGGALPGPFTPHGGAPARMGGNTGSVQTGATGWRFAIASDAGEASIDATNLPSARRQFRFPAGGTSPLRVAVSDLEQGLRVTVHVAGMKEPERRQMQDAIAALLARHGLYAGDIQLRATPNLRTKG